MHDPGLLLASGLLAGSVVVAGSWATGPVYRRCRAWLHGIAPEDRTKLIGAFAAFPWVAAALLLLLAFLPSFITVPGLVEDHCLPHDHHPHLCLRHGCWMPSGTLWIGAGGLGLVGFALWLRLVLKVFIAHRLVSNLVKMSRPEQGMRVLPTRRPMAFTAGFWRPETVISDSVLTTLSRDDLGVVLAHERAHATRRDALWRVSVEALVLGVPERTRRVLLEDYALACEEVCDRKAVQGEVTPCRVAEVLIRMQRLGCLLPQGVAGATGSHVVQRVQALLGEPYPPRPRGLKLFWFGPLLVLLADPVHHAAETLLGWLLS